MQTRHLTINDIELLKQLVRVTLKITKQNMFVRGFSVLPISSVYFPSTVLRTFIRSYPDYTNKTEILN